MGWFRKKESKSELSIAIEKLANSPSVEMLEQEISHSKWVIHIFDKESKIEVARYE